jgi:hypothetical protein
MDLFEGRRRRDEGMGRARMHANGWFDSYVAFIGAYARRNAEFLMEYVRMAWLNDGNEPPPSAGAWGAAAHQARRLGLIAKTGRWAPSSSALNHAHVYAVWRAARSEEMSCQR